VARAQAKARELLALAEAGRVRVRLVAKAVGLFQWFVPAVRPAPLYLRDLYTTLEPVQRLRAGHSRGWQHGLVRLGPAACTALTWWAGTGLRAWTGVEFGPWPAARLLTVTTDAAGEARLGWGGWTRVGHAVLCAQGHWANAQATWGIQDKELAAVLYTLQSFDAKFPAGSQVLVRSDNMGVVSYLRRGRGRLAASSRLATQIWQLCLDRGWALHGVEHIPGRRNCLADRLSRTFDRSDWKLHPDWFAYLDLFGPHTIDRFASALNRQGDLPYNSRFHDVGSTGVDALAQKWRNEINWVNPDFSLIDDVLALVVAQWATATIIVPDWRSQAWWPLLQRLAPAGWQWVPIPQEPGVFLSGSAFNRLPGGAPLWGVWAVHIVNGGAQGSARRSWNGWTWP
jgi:hypothetical protein